MNNELKPYDEYKEVDLLWIDKLPNHWKVVGNRTLWAERKTQNCIDEELLSVTIKRGIIRQSDLLKNTSKKDSSNLDKSKYKLVLPMDIAYNKMRMWQGAVGASKYKGIVSPAYIILKPIDEVNPKYYHYLLRTPDYIEESHRYSYGMCDDQLNLRYEDFKQMKIIKPPLDEQDKIVKYLDFQLAKINKFIKAKKKIILALKEQKQAVINEAITKGINPNVKMKPSGIAWLGDIPEHWEIKRAKCYLMQIDKRSNDGKEQLLSVSHITGITPRSQKNVNMFMAESTEGYKICKKGMIAVNTMWAWMGAIGVSNYNGIISPSYHTYTQKDKENYDNNYLDNLLRVSGYVDEYRIRSTGIRSSRLRLYPDKFLEIFIVRPPLDEQKSIGKYIHKKLEYIDKSIHSIEQEIDLITEYRTRLISDIVTGKVDVRNIVIDEIQDEDLEIEETEDEIIDSEEDIEIGESGE